MIIQTRDFELVEISEEDIIRFPDGILAFEETKDYVLLSGNEEGNPFLWLQAVHSETPCFIVINPYVIWHDYKPVIPPGALKKMQVTSVDFLRYLVIAVVPKNVREMTVNLRSPIVINSEKNIAMQVVLEQGGYGIRHPLFEDEKEVEQGCSLSPEK